MRAVRWASAAFSSHIARPVRASAFSSPLSRSELNRRCEPNPTGCPTELVVIVHIAEGPQKVPSSGDRLFQNFTI